MCMCTHACVLCVYFAVLCRLMGQLHVAAKHLHANANAVVVVLQLKVPLSPSLSLLHCVLLLHSRLHTLTHTCGGLEDRAGAITTRT